MSKTIMALRLRECRWIVSDAPARYCAAPTVGDCSWCAEHYQIVYGKVSS